MEFAKVITKKDSFKTRYAHLCSIYDKDNNLIDEGIVIYFKSPYSYTGEDVVEFQTHGNSLISQMIIDELLDLGARLANPGEFTKRAFLNGKLDLSQAEAISSLIDAKSKEAVKLLSKQLKGELKEFVEDVRERLVEVLAYIEVNIDYAEEDLPSDIEVSIQIKLEELKKLLNQTLLSSRLRDGMIDGFKVAIIGKPNVGKSTILNRLLSYDRAIISDIAGTTRDTIEESLRIGSHLVKIVDTAGIRDASDEIEKIGIKRSKESAKESDIVLAVFDLSKEFDSEDAKILSLMEELKDKKEIIAILNKADKEQKFDKTLLDGYKLLEFSKEHSIDSIVTSLQKLLNSKTDEDSMMLTSTRQIKHVEEATKHIEEALENLQLDELELFAYNINDAINSISSITTTFERDEILDKMFSNFCLGK